MKLPNSENAVVDIAKIRGYCLSNTHLRGRHKARVFQSALGLTAEDTAYLREALLQAARTEEADLAASDEHGRRYTIEFAMVGRTGTARVRSHWIVRTNESHPRFVTCYIV